MSEQAISSTHETSLRYTELQLAFHETRHMSSERAVKDSCLPMTHASAILEDPGNTLLFLELSPDQKILLRLVEDAQVSEMGKTLALGGGGTGWAQMM